MVLEDLFQYIKFFEDPISRKMLFAFVAIFIGVIIAKLVSKVFVQINQRLGLQNTKTINSFARLLELLIVILSLIIALDFLNVDPATVIISKLFSLIPNLIILMLLVLLGFIIINIVVEIIKSTVVKIGFSDYLDEMGISKGFVENTFFLVKVLLFMIILSASFTYVGLSLPFIDNVLIALIYGFVAFVVISAYHSFKDPIANLFAGIYLEKKLLKRGQFIKVDKYSGEFVAISNHGVTIKLPTGYNVIVPNKKILEDDVFIKRTTLDLDKLESVRSHFVAQLPSFCGPASAQMMLSFFGFDIAQERLGKLAKTKTPGGTGPRKLVDAVTKATNNFVNGAFIKFDSITNLRDELKSWLSEGGLPIVWFKKDILFKKSKGRGHYVLCVGIDGDELVLLDPSKQTAGVYLVDYSLLEEAMAEYDKKRGYIVFAKKGSPAYWRIKEGLVYHDVSAYKELSKSFERHLKKLLRKNAAVHNLISDYVFAVLDNNKPGVKHVWAPPESSMKRKSDVKAE